MKLESPDKRMLEAHRCALKDVASGEQTKLVVAEDLVALKPPADQDVVSRTLWSHWPFPSTVSLVRSVQYGLLHQLIGTGIRIPRAGQNPVLPRAQPSSSLEGYQHLDCDNVDPWAHPCPKFYERPECAFGHRDRIHRSVCGRPSVVDWSEPRHHFRGHGYLLRCARGVCFWQSGRCGQPW